MGKKKALFPEQAEELKRLQGDRTHVDWCAMLDVPPRTYYRYIAGTREAPGALMKLARIKGARR